MEALSWLNDNIPTEFILTNQQADLVAYITRIPIDTVISSIYNNQKKEDLNMAGRTRRTAAELLEAQIEKAQAEVDKIEIKLTEAKEKLQTLLDKKDESKKTELLDALTKSGKSFEEIMEFLSEK